MKLLLDHNLPRRLRTYLPGHEVKTTREMGWDQLRNGMLIKSASDAGFAGFITIDKNIEQEQNLAQLPTAVIVMDAVSNALPGLLPLVPFLQQLLGSPLKRMLYIVKRDGVIIELTKRRGKR